jgi:MFS transporter, ACS family, hexuronate transporter
MQSIVETEAAPRYSNVRRGLVLCALFGAWVLAYADRVAITIAIIPISNEFRLGPAQIGFVLSGFYWTYTLMNLVGGWLSDRFGSRRVLTLCICAWSLFTSLTGSAWSFSSLVFIRMMFGAGEGGFPPSSSVTLAESFPKRQRGRAKSFVIGAAFLGSAIGSGPVAASIHAFGWRASYFFLGASGLVVALAMWLIIKPAAPKSASPPGPGRLKALLRNRGLRQISGIFFFANCLSAGLGTWLPFYLSKAYHTKLVVMGFAASIPYIVSLLVLNVAGYVLDKKMAGSEWRMMAAGAAVMTGATSLMLAPAPLEVEIALWTLGMAGYSLVYATVFAIPLKLVADQDVGTAAGIVNVGGQAASALTPAVLGLLLSANGAAFNVALGLLVASGVCAIFLASTFRNGSMQPPQEHRA